MKEARQNIKLPPGFLVTRKGFDYDKRIMECLG